MAWSERFIALEERLFNVEGELRLELTMMKESHSKAEVKQEKDLQSTKTALEYEFRHKFEVRHMQTLEKHHAEQLASLLRSLDEKAAGHEAALRDTDLELRDLIDARFDQLTALITEMDKVDEGESVESSDEEEANGALVSSVASPKQSRPGSSLDAHHLKDMRKVKNLHLRVLNLEKRMAKLHTTSSGTNHQRNSSLASHNAIAELRFEDPEQRDDIEHEAHLRLVALLKETQELKDMMKSISNTTLPDLKLETVPNFKHYVTYMSRLQSLEERMSDLSPTVGQFIETQDKDWQVVLDSKAEAWEVKRLAKSVKDLSSLVQKAQERKQSYHEHESAKEKSINEVQKQPEEQLPSFSVIHDSSLEDSVSRLQDAVSRLATQLNNKVSKTELEKFLRLQTNTSHSAEHPSQDAKDDSTFMQLEERLNRYWFELKDLQKSMAAIIEAVREEFHDRLKQQSQDAEEQLTGMHSHLMTLINDINDAISVPAESSDSANLTVMRALNARLQKEVKEIRVELNEIALKRPRSAFIDQGFLGVPDAADEVAELGAPRNWGSVMQKHEVLLKSLQTQIQSLNSEFETQQSLIKKNQDLQLTQSIKQLEELRYNVSDIMAKVQEGSKLNQRDLEKLNELYRQLEGKSDREEILQKVDKRDLNRAYRFLSKKIETLSKEVEQTERISSSHADNPAAVRKKLDTQCLACGTDIAPIPLKLDREWRSWGRFPPNTYKVRSRQFGPGFSKILPILKTSADQVGRTDSMQTERHRNGSNSDLRRSISDFAHISLSSTQRNLKPKQIRDSPK